MSRWRTALVTGASSGIGEQFARTLAGGGTHLVLVARRVERLEELAAELRDANGVEVEVSPADLTDPGARAAAADRLRDGVDLLVNNAGVGFGGPFHEGELKRQRLVLDLNVTAVVELTHAALGPMVDRGRGAVITVGSVAGFQPMPFNATYASSKAFVITWSQALHEELRGTGVHVTALAPGFVKTEMTGFGNVDDSGGLWLDKEQVVREALRGAARNEALVVPGAAYKAVGVTTRMLPRAAVRRVTGLIGKQRHRR